jgi:SAM-dependent methyltransferase
MAVFAVPPDRRQRIAALGFDYPAQPVEAVAVCNLCGRPGDVTVATVDRYGYPARALGCGRCGLVWLSPRMTAPAYAAFYGGVYRPLVSAYHGRRIDAVTIQGEQREYAAERGDLLAQALSDTDAGTLLDIGGSTGVVAHALAERFGLRATVLDPAPAETAQARGLGLDIVEGLVETADLSGRRFDVITLCQTVDHLLDVHGTLCRIRELVADRGVFFVDIVDLRAATARAGRVEGAIKIDHPYYLVEETMTAYLARTGFEVLERARAADGLHVSYVTRPGAADPAALPPEGAASHLWRELDVTGGAGRA